MTHSQNEKRLRLRMVLYSLVTSLWIDIKEETEAILVRKNCIIMC
jgi:hypothetical protein